MKRFFKIALFLILAFATPFLAFASEKGKYADVVVDYNSYELKTTKYFDSSIFISENNFQADMESIAEPYLKARMSSNTMDTSTGDYIYYETFKADNQKAVIVMFHGFSEFTNKFNENAYYFLKSGYSVVRFDHNGHGNSIRKVDNLSKVYTNDWENYLEDAHDVILAAAKPLAGSDPLYLYAHSMGGGIGVAYLEKYPETFTKAVLNCPMIEINCGSLTEDFSQFICKFMRAFGNGKGYIPGNNDYEVYEDFVTGEESYGPTVSKNRNNYFTRYRNMHENYQTNGATYAWTDECITATKKIRSKKEASKIQVPVLLFQADNDVWVKPKGQNILRKNTDKVTLAFYPEVEHEIYASHDKYLPIYYEMILEWFGK